MSVGANMKVNGVIGMLNRKSPKIIQINDIIEWYNKGEIVLSPKYQRNSVWNESAKSYLIDSIIRGLPIPPIFIRQRIDVNTRKTFREIIDGQQRLRAITEFANDRFKISKSHNELYGGKFFSQLDDDVKSIFLEYELFAEIIGEDDDAVIYDMFARLNANNCVLNKQELRNSKYWGEFKVAAYNTAAEYRDFFITRHIFTEKQLSRMDDVEFVSVLINLCLNGIDSDTPKSIDLLYQKYDESFIEFETISSNFKKTIVVIDKVFDYLNSNNNCFTTKVYFYTLFAAIYNQLFGLNNSTLKRSPLLNCESIDTNIQYLFDKIISFVNCFEKYVAYDSSEADNIKLEFLKFAKNHKTRTTNKNERTERIVFLNDWIVGA